MPLSSPNCDNEPADHLEISLVGEREDTMTAPSRISLPPPVPALQHGERLSREEFERRYEAMPELKKAELIEGVVYMPSPVRFEQHGSPHADLMAWLGVYRAATPGVRVGDNTTIRLDLSNEPQPDAVMIVEPAFGGQARIDAEGFLAGGPELVAEIAASNVSVARNSKLRVYQRHNIREYILWREEKGAIDWYVLRQGEYELLQAMDAVLHSEQFPGLWLDAPALLRFDLGRVFQVLQQGLASPEHAAFVAQLRQRTGGQT
jgi:hypothetical protein